MEFFDCNCYFGMPSTAPASPAFCPTIEDLERQLDRVGIAQALVWHIAQLEVSPQRGNQMLADAIAGKKRFIGCWTLLPPVSDEMPVERLLREMKAAGVRALRAFPSRHRFVLNGTTLGPLLEAMTEKRIPLVYSMRSAGIDAHLAWRELHELMREFPRLTLLICDHGSWGCDRYFRPLLDAYERVYVDTALYFIDAGIESLVERYGPTARIVYGSGLPERYQGGMMMAIRHGEIPEAAKEAIAGGTMRRLMKEVQL